MIPTIGPRVGAYILLRAPEMLLGQTPIVARIVVKGVAVITIITTVLGIISLATTQAPAPGPR